MSEKKTYTTEQEFEALQQAIDDMALYPFWQIHESGTCTSNQIIEYIELHAPKPPSICLPLFHQAWKRLYRRHDLNQWPRCSKIGRWLEKLSQDDCSLRKQRAQEKQSVEEFFFWPYDADAMCLVAVDNTYSYDWLDVTWQRAIQLDPCFCDQLYVGLCTPKHAMFFLQRPDKEDPKYREYWPLEIKTVREKSEAITNMGLEEILWSLRVKPEQIVHIQKPFELCPCQVMRQDDHGNEFEVANFTSHLEGRWYVHEMERAIHKQTYWIEPR